tara:strand:- start:274 stop:516 length:243 start_codon:yes stop_codon:yes gene_type:complete
MPVIGPLNGVGHFFGVLLVKCSKSMLMGVFGYVLCLLYYNNKIGFCRLIFTTYLGQKNTRSKAGIFIFKLLREDYSSPTT